MSRDVFLRFLAKAAEFFLKTEKEIIFWISTFYFLNKLKLPSYIILQVFLPNYLGKNGCLKSAEMAEQSQETARKVKWAFHPPWFRFRTWANEMQLLEPRKLYDFNDISKVLMPSQPVFNVVFHWDYKRSWNLQKRRHFCYSVAVLRYLRHQWNPKFPDNVLFFFRGREMPTQTRPYFGLVQRIMRDSHPPKPQRPLLSLALTRRNAPT